MKRFLNLICAITVMALFQGVSFADDVQLETITVTAEKRAADPQEVPTPMNVMSDTFVQDTGIDTMQDMARYVPNIILDSWGLNQSWVVFRGMSASEFLGTSSMVLNIDGLSSDSNYGFDTSFEDVERVEVLRGPQGTLYGKNAISGAINIVTKKPGNDFTGMVGFSAEERNGLKAKFALSGPLKKDRFYMGLSGGYEQTDGYLNDETPGAKDNIDGHDKHFLTLKLRATPGKDNDIIFKYSHNEVNGAAPSAVFSNTPGYDIYTGLTDNDYDDSKSLTDSLLLNMEFRRQFADITSITSYKNVNTDETVVMGSVGGASAMGIQDFELPSFTQELRVASHGDKGTRWITGLFYDNSKYDVSEMSSIYDYTVYTFEYNWMPVTKSQTYAVFAEATIPLFTEKFSVTLGGRYEKTEREMDYRLVTSMSGVTMADDSYSVDKEWSSVLGKIAFAYEPSENRNFYMSLTQGYTPGGFNYTTADPEIADFNETNSLNYEIGIKTKLLNNRVMLNANIFHSIYEDLQVMETNYVSGIYSVKNAGKAHTTGIETDIQAKLTKGLDIFLTAGLMEAKYDDFEMNTENFDGNYMIGAPKFTGTAGATYRHSSGFMGSASIRHTSKTYYAKSNSEQTIQESYETVNVKVGYESMKGYEIYLFVRNLTDEKYFTYMRDGGSSLVYNYIGEPRTAGIEVNYRF